MTTFFPFSGYRYNPDTVNHVEDVLSPPYDKISGPERANLWQRHDYNVVRLILPPPSDTEIDVATQSMDAQSTAWYEDAAQTLAQWKKSTILLKDPPSYYVYRQTYEYKGQQFTRTGIFGALQLSDQGGPHAHEFTFDGPKADRLRLLRATHTNLSPIFLLGDGNQQQWDEVLRHAIDPIFTAKDHEGQEHHLYAVSNPVATASIEKFFQQRVLVIADGHHRYETAVNFKNEMQQKTGKDPVKEPWGYVMAFIVPLCDPGLLVLPTHRLLKKAPPNWFDLITKGASPYCDITPIEAITGEAIRTLLAKEGNQDSIAVVSNKEAFLLTPKKDVAIPALEDQPEAIRSLNVSFLHHHLLYSCLDIDPNALHENIRYVRGEEESLNLIKNGECEGGFLLHSISAKTTFDISVQGGKMPQKSTDFYPKVPTGLLLRSVDEQEEPNA